MGITKVSYVIILTAWKIKLDRLRSISKSLKIDVIRKAVNAQNMGQI